MITMKMTIKKIICALLAVTAIFTLCACGKNKGKNDYEYADLTYSFISKEIPIPDFVNQINVLDYADGKVFFVGYYENNDGSQYIYEDRIGVMNEDGTNAVQIPVARVGKPDDGYISQYFFDKGNIWYLETVNVFDDDDKNTNGSGDNQIMPRVAVEKALSSAVVEPEKYAIPTSQKYYLHKIDMNCNELECIDFTQYANGDYFYISGMEFDDKGNVYVVSETKILIFDSEMQNTGVIEYEEYIDSFFVIPKTGKAYLRSWGEKGPVLKEVDLQSKQILNEDISLPGGRYGYSNIIKGDINNDFYLNDGFSLLGYNIGQEPKQIVNWIDSDINPSEMGTAIKVISEEKLFCARNWWDEAEQKSDCAVTVLTKRTGEQLKPKIRLIYGALWMDYNVQKSIIDFNKKSEKYRIQVVDYSAYNTEEDYEAGQKQLNNDIIAGKMPDILQVNNSSLPFDSYVAKGLFADLYPLMEKDPDINPDDYFTNILKAFEHNGKLYEIVPTFTIQTVFGKKSIFGDVDHISISELMDIVKTMPEGTEIFSDMTKAGILRNSLHLNGGNYVDKNTGVCSFDSEGFIKLLEFANSFPLEIDFESKYNEDYDWVEYEKMYRNNKTLLAYGGVYSLDELHYAEKAQFGEEVAFVGFPTEDGKSGSSVSPQLELAISAKSKAIDGAWEFVKYFLSEDYFKTQNYGLTLSKAKFEENAKKAMTPRTYIDENGVEVEQKNYYYIGDTQIDIGYPTQEQADRIRNLVETVSAVSRFDYNLSEIIMEEAEYFFNGQKSASEVAGIIQSKASIYVSESR